jgi:hypothetical protein
MDRDMVILREVGRWPVVLGRHIKELAGFSGSRVCDNRLKILVENKYLTRSKIFYGTPYVYQLTHKSRILLGLNKRADRLKLDQFRHDVKVLDAVIWLIKAKGLAAVDFTSEKQLHRLDGFMARRHRPDFTFIDSGRKFAAEVELSLKTLDRLEKNAKDNYLAYDTQLWLIERGSQKIQGNLEHLQPKYPNIDIMYLDDMK